MPNPSKLPGTPEVPGPSKIWRDRVYQNLHGDPNYDQVLQGDWALRGTGPLRGIEGGTGHLRPVVWGEKGGEVFIFAKSSIYSPILN